MQIIVAEYVPNEDAMLAALGLDPDSDEADDFLAMFREAEKLARPIAAIDAQPVEAADPSTGRVVVGGIEFRSKVLANHLADQETVWPFFMTCGREVYDWAQAVTDPFERFWAEEILQDALNSASVAFNQHFEREVYQDKTGVMNPGSLKDWPIEEQKPLFALFGDAPSKAGLHLTDSMLMLPNKSGSGIRFASEKGFTSCQMCPREKCPNRRAPYDTAMAILGM